MNVVLRTVQKNWYSIREVVSPSLVFIIELDAVAIIARTINLFEYLLRTTINLQTVSNLYLLIGCCCKAQLYLNYFLLPTVILLKELWYLFMVCSKLFRTMYGCTYAGSSVIDI